MPTCHSLLPFLSTKRDKQKYFILVGRGRVCHWALKAFASTKLCSAEFFNPILQKEPKFAILSPTKISNCLIPQINFPQILVFELSHWFSKVQYFILHKTVQNPTTYHPAAHTCSSVKWRLSFPLQELFLSQFEFWISSLMHSLRRHPFLLALRRRLPYACTRSDVGDQYLLTHISKMYNFSETEREQVSKLLFNGR